MKLRSLAAVVFFRACGSAAPGVALTADIVPPWIDQQRAAWGTLRM